MLKKSLFYFFMGLHSVVLCASDSDTTLSYFNSTQIASDVMEDPFSSLDARVEVPYDCAIYDICRGFYNDTMRLCAIKKRAFFDFDHYAANCYWYVMLTGRAKEDAVFNALVIALYEAQEYRLPDTSLSVIWDLAMYGELEPSLAQERLDIAQELCRVYGDDGRYKFTRYIQGFGLEISGDLVESS
ncbi:MAG: hypothetical protein QG604_340 [Candidatus Dependentiae bacterium]|nr:hypothetical protein [Candidatus Dependentiae bacterium]